MYNILKNVQILIALLKEYNIRYLVLSPGSRNFLLYTQLKRIRFSPATPSLTKEEPRILRSVWLRS